MVQIALSRFRDFLKETPEYSKFAYKIKPEQINKDMIGKTITEYKPRSWTARDYKRFVAEYQELTGQGVR